jgi:hypothetical protein
MKLRLFLVVMHFLTGIHVSGAAEAGSPPALSCDVLLDALNNKQIAPEFYATHCSRTTEVTAAVLTAPSAEQTVQMILSQAPSMMEAVKRYGPPRQVLALLGTNSADGRRSLVSGLNWSDYPELVDYITSAAADLYVEEFIPGDRTSSATGYRQTTPFWIAMRSHDSYFVRRTLSRTAVAPYRLDHDPSSAKAFPCAANLYLCVIRSNTATPDQKQDLVSQLTTLGVKTPSWTFSAISQDVGPYKLPVREVANAQVCASTGAPDCPFIMQILRQNQIPASGSDAAVTLTDYAGYDLHGRRHLLTGATSDGIVAAWIAAGADMAAPRGAPVELIWLKAVQGRITQHRQQIGKRIEFRDTMLEAGLLTFDPVIARFELRTTSRSYN